MAVNFFQCFSGAGDSHLIRQAEELCIQHRYGGDAIVPQSIDIPPEQVESLTDGGQVINGGRIFTPFWTTPISVKPGTMGGANWPPSSYDPNTGLLYVCASDRISSFRVNPELEQPGPNQVYMGGRFTQAQADDRGW